MVKKLMNLLKDNLLKKLFKNASTLLSGNVIASVFGLISLALTARALGAQAFGTLVLIQTYVLVMDGVINFQSWQAVVKFGTEFRESRNFNKFKALIKFVLFIDVFTAIIGTIVAVGLFNLVAPILDMNEDSYNYVAIFSLVILFHISGVPIAILRIFEKFKLFAFQVSLAAFIKLLLVSVLYLMEAGLTSFVIAWAASDIIGHLVLLYFGYKEIKKQSYHKIFTEDTSLLRGYFKSIWSFVISTNLSSSIRMTTRQFDVLIVGGMLGNSAVGLYKVAKQFSMVLTKLSDPLYQAIYPQLTQLYNNEKINEFKKLMYRSSFLITIPIMFLWLAFFIFGDLIINLTVGASFLEGKGVMIWYMLAIVVSVVSFPLQPAMLAQGLPQFSFWVHLFSTIIYFLIINFLINSFGLEGAGISYLIYYLTWSLCMLIIVWKKMDEAKSTIEKNMLL